MNESSLMKDRFEILRLPCGTWIAKWTYANGGCIRMKWCETRQKARETIKAWKAGESQ